MHVYVLYELNKTKQYVLFLIYAAIVVFGNVESSALAIQYSIFEIFYFSNLVIGKRNRKGVRHKASPIYAGTLGFNK